jgi:hypothetical protein
MKDINIVLLNYFYKEDIIQALNSLVADIAGCSYDVQITVADNSENKDGIKEVVFANFKDVKYVDCGGNVGCGRGHTIGFKTTPARYYFALNPDSIIPPGEHTVERIIRFMDSHPKIGCMGPKLVNTDGTLQYSCYRFDLPSIFVKPFRQINWDKKYKRIGKYISRLLMKDFDHNETRPVDWVLGAAMIVRGEVAEKVGWFDPRYFMYLEDCDWCRAIWESGWPVYYVHDIVIQHRYSRESAKVPGILKALFLNRLARAHLSSWLKYMWKWRSTHKYYPCNIQK